MTSKTKKEAISAFLEIMSLNSKQIHWNFQNNCKFIRNSKDYENSIDFSTIFDYLNEFQHKRKKIHLNTREKAVLMLILSTVEIDKNNNFFDFKNQDWIEIAQFFPFIPFFSLKFEFFSMLKCNLEKSWSIELDTLLLRVLNKSNVLNLINPKARVFPRIKWTKIALELSKNCESIAPFKNSIQCKERWLNHLNPLIKKKPFSLEEDILLLNLALKEGTKWANISKSMEGRNQHQIKNRFIFLIKEINEISREKVRSIIKNNNGQSMIQMSLNYLLQTRDAFGLVKGDEKKQFQTIGNQDEITGFKVGILEEDKEDSLISVSSEIIQNNNDYLENEEKKILKVVQIIGEL